MHRRLRRGGQPGGRRAARPHGPAATLSGACPATINRALAALAAFTGWDAAKAAGAFLPRGSVKYVRAEDPGPRALAPDDQRARLEAAAARTAALDGVQDSAMLALLLQACLRVSEVCALQRADFIEEAGRLVVRVAAVAAKGAHVRRVPLSVSAEAAMRVHPARAAPAARLAGAVSRRA